MSRANERELVRRTDIVSAMRSAMRAVELESRRYDWVWTGVVFVTAAAGYRGLIASSAAPLVLAAFFGMCFVVPTGALVLSVERRRRSAVESHQLPARLIGLCVFLLILLAMPPDGATWWAIVLIALPMPLAFADEVRWRRRFRLPPPVRFPASQVAGEVLADDASLKVLAALSGVVSARLPVVSRTTGLTEEEIEEAAVRLTGSGLLDVHTGVDPLGTEFRATALGKAALGLRRH